MGHRRDPVSRTVVGSKRCQQFLQMRRILEKQTIVAIRIGEKRWLVLTPCAILYCLVITIALKALDEFAPHRAEMSVIA